MDEHTLFSAPAMEDHAEKPIVQEELISALKLPVQEAGLVNVIEQSEGASEPAHTTLERIAAFGEAPTAQTEAMPVNPSPETLAMADRMDQDPRYSEIAKQLSDNALQKNMQILRGQGMSEAEARSHMATFGGGVKMPDGSIRINFYPRKIQEEFAKHYPTEYAAYRQQEQHTVYDKAEKDAAFNELQDNLRTIEDTYRPLDAGKEYRSFTSQGDIDAHRQSQAAAYQQFVTTYPEKAEAYWRSDPKLAAALVQREGESTRTYLNAAGEPDWQKDPAFAVLDSIGGPSRILSAKLEEFARRYPEKARLYAAREPMLQVAVPEKPVPQPDARDLYEAQSEHRFLTPENEVAKQRLEAVQTTFNQYATEHPEVAGLSLFGSMAKGYATEESDIDGYLFVDADRVMPPNNEQPLLTVSHGGGDVIENRYTFRPDVQNAYTGDFRRKIQEATGLSNEKLRHLTVEPISASLVQREVQDLKAWAESSIAYQKQVGLLTQDPGAWKREWQSRPQNRIPTTALSALFHLQVGKGLNKYRQLLVEELSTMGEPGEFLWTEIMKGTEMMEQNLQVGTAKHYPRTLADAKRLYWYE